MYHIIKLRDRLGKKNTNRQKKEHHLLFRLILSILSINNDKSFFINELFGTIEKLGKKNDGTGLTFKVNTIDSINRLEKMGLIIREKGKKNKHFIKLTALGQDIGMLIVQAEYYRRAYFKLIRSMDEKVFFIDSSILPFLEAGSESVIMNDPILQVKDEVRKTRFRLGNAGWKDEEISNYNQHRSNLVDYKEFFDKNFIDVILTVYSIIVKKYQIRENLGVMRIIKSMIMDIMDEKIELLVRNSQEGLEGYYTIRFYQADKQKTWAPEKASRIIKHSKDFEQFQKGKTVPQILGDEIKGVVQAYYELLKNRDEQLVVNFGPRHYLENYVKILESIVRMTNNRNLQKDD